MSASFFCRFTGALLLLIAINLTAVAQQFGGNPPSIKWQQVNVPAAKVIFPVGQDSIAARVAQIIQRINNAGQVTIGHQQKKVSIVLQTQTTVANAYVGLAPFRSEFYLTPDQNSFELGSLPWADQLAIHEFRHVQQYNNFNVGFSKVLSVIFGQGGQAIANNAAIPDWFFEGDAVFNETLVSAQGRGRLPYFYNGYRALWAADKNYSWMKLRNGSFRDYIPDWYPMGYMLVAYGREKYGNLFWRNVTHDAATFRDVFYPMQHAIKRYSGKSFTDFRSEGLNYFKQQYQYAQVDNPASNKVISREYPAYINDSTLLYVRSTYRDIPRFVVNKNGVETSISVRSQSLDNYFDYRNGKIIYAAHRPDLRWSYSDYSELRVLDIASGKEHKLTRSTKYFAPAFNADASKVVAVKAFSGQSWLHILDASTGKLITEIANPDHLFFTYPKFFNEETLVSAVRNKNGEMSLALISIKAGAVKYLLPFSYRPIAFPVVKGDTIYFSATIGKNDRLFAIVPATGKLMEMKADAVALNQYQPAIAGNKLAWVEFTANGYALRQDAGNSAQWVAVNNNTVNVLPDFDVSVLKKDSSSNKLADVAEQSLPVTKYNKAHGLFNFHSLIPDFSDPNYSLALVGENVLNTFQSQVSFNYNRDEGYKQFGFDAIYGALFPYLRGGVDYTLDRRSLYRNNRIYYNETAVHAGLQVPLNFSAGKHITQMSFGSDVYYTSSVFQSPYRAQFEDRAYTYLNNSFTISNRAQQARQHIYPRWGQSLTLNYKRAISGLTANQFLASGTLFLPGLVKNHSIVISVAHQQKGNDDVISFSNGFPLSRGYTAENLHSMNKIGLNYHLPLVYPDAGVANTLYFMRIRTNLFYDYTHVNDTYSNGRPFRADFRTAGAELYFDTKWFNQQALTFGIRYSRLLNDDLFGGAGRNRIELVLPVSFF